MGIKGTNNGHIANCIQGCRYLWTTGTEEGIAVYDLADKTTPKFLGTFTMPVPKQRAGEPTTEPGFTHDVFVDKTGIAWITGEDGTFGYRTTGDPLKPQLVFRSDENVTNSGNSGPSAPDDANGNPLDFLHHNSMRTALTDRGKGRGARLNKTATGDVMAITEEDYTRPGCNGQGSLQTWQITGRRNSDGTPQAGAAGPVDHRAERAAEPARPLARDRQLLRPLVRRRQGPGRPGLVRPGRALPGHLGPAQDPPGGLLRHRRQLLGRLLRPLRPQARGRLRPGHRGRHRRAADRPARRRP